MTDDRRRAEILDIVGCILGGPLGAQIAEHQHGGEKMIHMSTAKKVVLMAERVLEHVDATVQAATQAPAEDDP